MSDQLPLFPYAGQVPHANTDTSRAAAVALEERLGDWQAKVLLSLLESPATDEQLEERLGCVRTRTARPRRRELELAGFVEDSGERTEGYAGRPQIVWRLTAKGRARGAAFASGGGPPRGLG